MDRIKFTLNIEENEDSNYLKKIILREIKEEVQKDDEDSKNEESLKNYIFHQLKDNIIRRNSYQDLCKEQKLYVIECLKRSGM